MPKNNYALVCPQSYITMILLIHPKSLDTRHCIVSSSFFHRDFEARYTPMNTFANNSAHSNGQVTTFLGFFLTFL